MLPHFSGQEGPEDAGGGWHAEDQLLRGRALPPPGKNEVFYVVGIVTFRSL